MRLMSREKPRNLIHQFLQVFIVNDTIKEPTEQFKLHLGAVFSTNAGGGKLGGRTVSVVKITDDDRKMASILHSIC